MDDIIYINDLVAGQVNFTVDDRLRWNNPQTRIKYTAESGLSDWESEVSGTITGKNTSPYYTTQLPNIDQAEEVYIGTSVTGVTTCAFRGCTSLKIVTVPEGVEAIGQAVFQECAGLETASIPNSVTSFNTNSFRDCSSLGDIAIPNGTTSIGNYAFSGCSRLT